MKNEKLIAKTRILCTDTPKHPRHEVRLYEGGRIECDCGADAVEEGRRLGTAVSLGAANLHRRSCTGLVAFVAVGLPKLVTARVDVTGAWGGWKDAWVSYAENALVRDAFRDLAQRRDEEHAETLRVAHRALTSCSRYRDGMSRTEFADEVRFMPDGEVKVGASVALFSSDTWTVPLQGGWLESVGKAKPVIDGRFVVGMSEHPGFVYALDGSNDHGFTVCEFAVIGNKLGKIGTASK